MEIQKLTAPAQLDLGTAPKAEAATPPLDAFEQTNPKAVDVRFSYNPKDAATLPDKTVTLHGVTAGAQLETPTYKLTETLSPSPQGDYVFDHKQDPKSWVKANSFASAVGAQAIVDAKLGTIADVTGHPQVTVNALKGIDLNAYFRPDENSENFFYWTLDSGETIYAGAAGDIVGHENGHKDLNNRRPGYFNSFSPDPGAFHESFGDVEAFLEATQDPEVIARMVEQTGGDLSKTNVASESGKELGRGVNALAGHDATGGDFIRNADNNFKWADPATLEDSPSDPSKLGSEVHNFSRLWTGAFYDVFKGLVSESIQGGQKPADAIKSASNEGWAMYRRLFGPTGDSAAPKGTAPEGDFTYKDMAKAWIKGEKELGGKHAALVAKVMADRGILPAGAAETDTHDALPSGTRTLTVQLTGGVPDALKGARVSTTLSGSSEGGQADQNAEAAARLHANIGRMIKNGDILLTSSAGVPSEEQMRKVDSSGTTVGHFRAYLAVDPDGSKTIKRTPIFD